MGPFKRSWEGDLGLEISEEDWTYILDMVHSSSICARHGVLQCKILHRSHYTNAKLAKIYPGVSDACYRCNQSPADLVHMMWSCPKLNTYWTEIFKTFQTVFCIPVDPDPRTAIFGISVDEDTTAAMRRVIAFTTLLARRLILFKWKHASPPSHSRWIKEVVHCLKLERIRFSLRGSLKTFRTTWGPFIEHIETLTDLADDAVD